MDRTKVAFSGSIGFVTSDSNFLFYDANNDPFGASIDAGRDVRERVENECATQSFMISLDDLCKIKGSGTVEIRGSRIFISIEQVEQLGK